MSFNPIRKISFQLSNDCRVTLFTDGEDFGVQFTNGEKRTRARLSKAAMGALIAGFHALEAGVGEPCNPNRTNDGFEWEEVMTNWTTPDAFQRRRR